MDDFKLTLEGDGISVDRTVDRTTALAILNSILSPKQVTSTDHSSHKSTRPSAALPVAATNEDDVRAVVPSSGQTLAPDKPVSLREYVNEFEPKTNAQVILCIAQFLALHERVERFKRDDIKPKFPSAGEALPKNYSRDFQTAIDKGWVGADPSNKELFFVTRTGENQLKSGFRGRRN